MITYLEVPYSEKDKAKLLGAKWDSNGILKIMNGELITNKLF